MDTIKLAAIHYRRYLALMHMAEEKNSIEFMHTAERELEKFHLFLSADLNTSAAGSR